MIALLISLLWLLPAAMGLTPYQLPRDAADFHQRNFDTISKIYNLSTYPNNQAFLKDGAAAVPSGLFSKDVIGRVTPLGNFSGIDDTVEYFFALTPDPSPPSYATWTNDTITHFVSECPEVAATVVYGRTMGVNASVPSTYQKQVSTIKQIAFWRFDDTGAVLKYDAWLPTLQQWWNTTHDVAHYPIDEVLVRQQLCQTTQVQCTGADKQWDSVDQCVATLSQKPMGNFDNLWGDNIWCRALHVRLTPIRPDVHCAHVGPNGGGKCVNIAYNDAYFDDEALFGEPPGDTFVCHKGSGS
ncbi:hypothetical protein J7T55_006598 [Diaporthe amygdali]|uniref:uncharacterized protein n=1 Tax=Phomopsis amygdali TaxID=1214568 RepID=UPI0022FE9169|nr:uncharacterized protein J7T55_006598 [Diaporthe amygdali]KAJ0125253.1 hypothetical protein J7T55_006598 [Diaporthe amygdali]